MQQPMQHTLARHLPEVSWWEIAVPVLAFVAVIVLPCLFAVRVICRAWATSEPNNMMQGQPEA